MSKSLFKRADDIVSDTRRLPRAGAVRYVRGISVTGGSGSGGGPGSEIVLANGGSRSGGDPGNGIVR